MRADVYYNLRRKTFSVRVKGKVILHTDDVTMQDCVFVVNKAGRERVLREKRKNVHAFVRGDYIMPLPFLMAGGFDVGYNPYKADYFYSRITGERVDHAQTVVLRKVDGKPTIEAYGAR